MATARAQLAALRARIAELEKKAAELEAKAATEVEVLPEVGAVVQFMAGRGDEKVMKSGTVLGIRVPKEGEKGGTVVKVLVGEGYDAEVVGVFPSALVAPAVEMTDVEPAAE